MSDAEKFLTRWSRRKRDAAAAPDEAATEQAVDAHGAAGEGGPHSAEPTEGDPIPAVLRELPPLDSITAGTDIRAFLQVGVPADLTRAALRRAWVADPAIRDFVGLAENSWDFTAPGGAPGFGPLLPIDDVRRLVAEVFGDLPSDDTGAQGPSTEGAPATNNQAVTERAEPAVGPDYQVEARSDLPPQCSPLDPGENAHPPQRVADIALQNDTASQQHDAAPVRRRHGGALAE